MNALHFDAHVLSPVHLHPTRLPRPFPLSIFHEMQHSRRKCVLELLSDRCHRLGYSTTFTSAPEDINGRRPNRGYTMEVDQHKAATKATPEVTSGRSSHLAKPTANIVFPVSLVNHFPGGQFARLPARTRTPDGVYAAV